MIVAGYPRFVEDRTHVSGFNIIPARKAFVMIPFFDKCNVYELFDDSEMRTLNSAVATVRGQHICG
jgi:hypothetical protein